VTGVSHLRDAAWLRDDEVACRIALLDRDITYRLWASGAPGVDDGSTRRLAHSIRPIASGQHPSAVAKHDQPTRILLDTGSVDRSGSLEIGVPIENLLDAGPFTARLEKLDRVFCNVGRHWPDSRGPRLSQSTNFRSDPRIIQLSVWQSPPPAKDDEWIAPFAVPLPPWLSVISDKISAVMVG
jgi:hypothetical protein